jgi:hypothetical protein
MPYGVRQTVLDEPNAVDGLQRYWRSAFTDWLSDDFIDTAVDYAARFSSPLSAMLFFYMHGAATRVAADATAFSARDAQWDFDVIGHWIDPTESDRHIDWLRGAWSGLEPHLQGSGYINHLSADDRPEKVRASYGSNHDRLRRLKATYDPTNLFCMNPNIPPAD